MALPDSNTWYRLTNNYTGPGLFLSSGDITPGSLLHMDSSPGGASGDWQFFPYGSNYYIRSGAAGPTLRLDIFYDTNNVPMPILQSSNASSPNQEWSLRAAGAAFGIENVALGNSVYLDTYSDTLQPFFEVWGHSGQLWTFTPAGPINDVLYSTVAGSSTTQTSTASSPISTSTTTSIPAQATASSSTAPISAESPTATSTSSSSSLSSGAIAGIAVGSAIIVILVAVLIFFLSRRKPNLQTANLPSPEYTGMAEAPGDQNFRPFKSELVEREQLEGNMSSKPGVQSALAELPSPIGHGYMPHSGRHVSELEDK